VVGGASLFESDFTCEHLALLFLVRVLVGVEFRHDLFRERFQAFADVPVRVFTGLIHQHHLADMAEFKLAELIPNRLRRADQAAAESSLDDFWVRGPPFHKLAPEVYRAGQWPPPGFGLAVELQRELEKGQAFGTLSRQFISLGRRI